MEMPPGIPYSRGWGYDLFQYKVKLLLNNADMDLS